MNLKHFFEVIRANKTLFSILIVSQLALIIGFAWFQLKFQIKALGILQNLASLAAASDLKSLAQDPLQIISQFSTLKTVAWRWFFTTLSLFLVNGFLWALTAYITNKATILRSWVRFIGFFFIHFLPSIVLGFVFLNSFIQRSLDGENVNPVGMFWVLGIVTAIASVLFFYSVTDLRKSLKASFISALRNIPRFLLWFIPALVVPYLAGYVVYLLADSSLFLLALSIVLFGVTLAITKFILVVARENNCF